MSRLVGGKDYSFDLKYVSGITYNKKSNMIVLLKAGQVTVVNNVTPEEFKEVQKTFEEYVGAKNERVY